MKGRDLPDLASFVAVVRHGSFARAAAELGVSRSAVSHAVRGLEGRLGLRLLNRTTRSVSPTDAGERLVAELAPALERITAAVDNANAFRAAPSGRIRLNVPRLAALLVVAPALPGFLAQHPRVEIELAVDDATVDIIERGFDAGIRFGERLANDMIAVPVGPPVEFAVVGSPSYLRDRCPPSEPRDLGEHECIGYRMRGSGRLFDWEFFKGDRELHIAVNGQLTTDSPEFMVRAALDGVGLAYAALIDVEHHLQSGALVRLLSDWCPPTDRLHLYYHGHRHMPAALRAFIDYLRGSLNG